jgi:transcriptional regulator with XRE-family HTH domain
LTFEKQRRHNPAHMSTPTNHPSTRRERPASQLQIGFRIREQRQKRDWSQRHLSALTGISPKRLSAYEVGHTQPPLQSLLRLARAFQVPLDLLLMPLADPATEKMEQEVWQILGRLRSLDLARREAFLSLAQIFFGLIDLMTAKGKGEVRRGRDRE